MSLYHRLYLYKLFVEAAKKLDDDKKRAFCLELLERFKKGEECHEQSG